MDTQRNRSFGYSRTSCASCNIKYKRITWEYWGSGIPKRSIKSCKVRIYIFYGSNSVSVNTISWTTLGGRNLSIKETQIYNSNITHLPLSYNKRNTFKEYSIITANHSCSYYS